MTLTLYSISGAPRPWRALLGLTFKRLDYEITWLQASKGEHKSPAFLELNPRGTVPVLTAGDTVIRDSIAILAWLDRAYPERPLFGDSPAQAAAVWQVTLESCDYLRAAIDGLLRPIFFAGADRPMPELQQAAGVMQDELARLERLLDGRDFLAGDAPSAADAVSFPEVRLVQRAVETHPALLSALGFQEPLDGYPRLADWKQRISAMDGYGRTLPPHWQADA